MAGYSFQPFNSLWVVADKSNLYFKPTICGLHGDNTVKVDKRDLHYWESLQSPIYPLSLFEVCVARSVFVVVKRAQVMILYRCRHNWPSASAISPKTQSHPSTGDLTGLSKPITRKREIRVHLSELIQCFSKCWAKLPQLGSVPVVRMFMSQDSQTTALC
jgi:hypothetical protein